MVVSENRGPAKWRDYEWSIMFNMVIANDNDGDMLDPNGKSFWSNPTGGSVRQHVMVVYQNERYEKFTNKIAR